MFLGAVITIERVSCFLVDGKRFVITDLLVYSIVGDLTLRHYVIVLITSVTNEKVIWLTQSG